jgi:hypothetical protein
MSKRKKKTPSQFQKLVQQFAGGRRSENPSNYAWWLDKGTPYLPWVDAIAAIDRSVRQNGKSTSDERKPLLELLRSQDEVTPEIIIYLDDFLDRYGLRNLAEHTRSHAGRTHVADLLQLYKFERPAHRPRTPAYDRTEMDAALEWATFMVRLGQAGVHWAEGLGPMSLEAAVKLVAPNVQFASLLKKYIRGDYDSARRMRNRRP